LIFLSLFQSNLSFILDLVFLIFQIVLDIL